MLNEFAAWVRVGFLFCLSRQSFSPVRSLSINPKRFQRLFRFRDKAMQFEGESGLTLNAARAARELLHVRSGNLVFVVDAPSADKVDHIFGQSRDSQILPCS